MAKGDASRQSEVSFPKVAEQPVMWGYENKPNPTDKHKAIVDQDTGKLFSIVSVRKMRGMRYRELLAEYQGSYCSGSHFS